MRRRLLAAGCIVLCGSMFWSGADAGAAATTRTMTISVLNGVACPSAATCVAVGGEAGEVLSGTTLVSGSWRPLIYTSTDAGQRWSAVATTGLPAADLWSVSCASVDHCTAAGAIQRVGNGQWNPVAGVAFTVDGHGGWSNVRLPSTAPINAVTCPAKDVCVAAGGRASGLHLAAETLFSADAGLRWSIQPLPAANGIPYGVSCPSASRCVEAGAEVTVTTQTSYSKPVAWTSGNGGRAWSLAKIAGSEGTGGPLAVSCGSATACLAAGDTWQWCQCGSGMSGHYGEVWATTDAGAQWSLRALPTEDGYDIWSLDAVSCWSATACAVAGSATKPGPVKLYYPFVLPVSAADHWSGDPSHALLTIQPEWVYGLSCSGAGTCVAVGQTFQNRLAAQYEAHGVWKAASM